MGCNCPAPGAGHATIKNFKRLPVADRLSIAGLVAMLDLNRNEATFRRYDAIDALTLFRQLGISERMIDEFLRPILLVGLFATGGIIGSCHHGAALLLRLAHQDSLDVRWIRSCSIAEQLIFPLRNACWALVSSLFWEERWPRA